MGKTDIEEVLADPGINVVLQYFADNPAFYRDLKSLICQASEAAALRKEKDELGLPSEEYYARSTHSTLLKLVSNTNLELVDSGIIPRSTEALIERIIHAQHEVPLGSPLPLLWPTYHDSPSAPTGCLPGLSASGSGDSDDPGLGRSSVNDLVRRLAVTSDPNFAYRPDLFNIRPEPAEAAAVAPSDHTISLPGP